MSTELPPLPASLTKALDAYADRVSEYDVAVKIDVGVTKAGQIATDACGKALEEVLAYARAAVAAEREACAALCDITPPYPFRPSIEAAHAIRART